MVRHFFLDKTCTIHKGSEYNTGNHPIMELYYGKDNSRGILHFNEKELIDLVNDKTFPDINKLSVKLKMTNCANINGAPYNRKHIKNMEEDYQRAISFDLILMALPQDFDQGLGYDYVADFWNGTPKAFSKEGCNWFQSYNGLSWNEEGVFSIETIKKEIEKYNNDEENNIIARQHFDTGLELLDMDITSYVKDVINGKPNYGLMLLFSPRYQEMEKECSQYVGFFTDKTNLYYHPFIEVSYNDYIEDNRSNFYIGKTNRLYLYASIDGEMINFDEMPVCIINDKEYEVKQASKGVYYAEISPKIGEMNSNTIYYDMWSNLSLNGEKIEDVEMEFVVLPNDGFINIGYNNNVKKNITPYISGINDNEELNRGEIREVNVEYQKMYSMDEKILSNKGEYRIYIKDGNREIDIFPYNKIEQSYLNNYFIVNTNDLIPNKYYVDVRIKYGREEKYFKEVLKFIIKNDMSKSLL